MNTQTYLDGLKEYANRFYWRRIKESPFRNEFFDYLDLNHDAYIRATHEERTEIRKLIRHRRLLFPQRYMAHLLFIYARERALEKLRSTGDEVWLLRGLIAVSMENFSSRRYEDAYKAYSLNGDSSLILAELYVIAEKSGIKPDQRFKEIARISDDKQKGRFGGSPMNLTMSVDGTLGRLIIERRDKGYFVGLW